MLRKTADLRKIEALHGKISARAVNEAFPKKVLTLKKVEGIWFFSFLRLVFSIMNKSPSFNIHRYSWKNIKQNFKIKMKELYEFISFSALISFVSAIFILFLFWSLFEIDRMFSNYFVTYWMKTVKDNDKLTNLW